MNFLPKILFVLAKRFGKVYFLVISLIMLISPEISPYSSWIFISLLAMMIGVNVGVELWLDSKRQINDILINEQLATVFYY